MKEDSIDDLKQKLSDEQERSARLLKELQEYIKAEEVIVAAGLLSKQKIEQAHEIVRTFS